jgi:hypothetical protein
MIVRVAGGNGAGKSHVVHRVIAMYEHRTLARDQLLLEKGTDGLQNTFVPGHYNIVNGGLDTVPSGARLAEMRERMRRHAEAGWHVLYEVSSQKEGSAWMLEMLRAGHACRHVLLSTSDDDRVLGVRGRGHGIREDLIRASGRRAERLTMELCIGGVPILVLSREAAFRRVLEHLRSQS